MASSGSGIGTPISSGGASSGTGLDPAQPLPRSLLPLARYAQIMNIPLAHFQQMAGPKAPLLRGCDSIWDQNAREDLADTMLTAEQMIADELGYWPAPKFITAEQHELGLRGVRNDWWNAELKTDYAYVGGYGTEKLTLLQADATVRYQNLNNNPHDREDVAVIGSELYNDLTACGAATNVAVFFRVADGAEDAAHPSWEIRPVKVDIDGSTMRITAPASLFVKPELWSLTERDCAGSDDPNLWRWNWDLDNLVSKVDVYCRTIDGQSPATLLWEPCYCTAPCSHESQAACAYPTDDRRGYFAVRPATWNGSTHVLAEPTYAHAPHSVRINYRAGLALDSLGRMDRRLERAIVKLTNALLPEPPCGYCDLAKRIWEEDRLKVDPLTTEAAALPWDMYTRGALEAWRIVKKLARGRAGKLGR